MKENEKVFNPGLDAELALVILLEALTPVLNKDKSILDVDENTDTYLQHRVCKLEYMNFI